MAKLQSNCALIPLNGDRLRNKLGSIRQPFCCEGQDSLMRILFTKGMTK
ncbi:hypothetical protein [Ammoniphilus sp. 3BR4]